MPESTIYMDYHATTPLSPQVLEAMTPFFCEHFGNANSGHAMGLTARRAVENARKQVATLLGAKPQEIIFTSGATESDNFALFGLAQRYRERGNHILVSSAEHSAILDPAKQLEKQGFEVTYLEVDATGQVRPETVAAAITPKTLLVSVMHANNEVGTVNPIAKIGALCHEKGVFFHTDAAQSVGHLKIDVNEMNIDLLSLSGHKMYGPKGVGALYLRSDNPKVDIDPIICGGGQERNLRSGTLNVPSIVGLGAAAELVHKNREEENQKVKALRDRLLSGMQSKVSGIELNGHPTERLPNHLSLYIPAMDSASLMLHLPNVCFSGGSACHTGQGASHVALAMGYDAKKASHCVRLGLGRTTTEQDVDRVIEAFAKACCP